MSLPVWPTVPPVPDLTALSQQLTDAGIAHNALGMDQWPESPTVHTYDAEGVPEALPPEAQSIVDAFLTTALAA